jgi:hypothetical protein
MLLLTSLGREGGVKCLVNGLILTRRPLALGTDRSQSAGRLGQHGPVMLVPELLSPLCDRRIIHRNVPGDRVNVIPVKLLLQRGDRPIGAVTAGLRCSRCGAKPAPVYLVAGLTRTACMGPPPSWAVELVPPS